MPLDTTTLRVAFAVVALSVLLLFYGATYRTTRSPYSGWWCASLLLFMVSSSLYLLSETSARVVGNPIGNALAVAGAAAVWAAAGSLRGTVLPVPLLLAAPTVVLVVSFLDDPANDVWSGGAVFLLGMATMIAMSFRELWLQVRSLQAGADSPQYRIALGAMTGVSALLAVFYLGRTVTFVAVGPDHGAFRTAFGSEATTLLTMVLLVVVTFSMSSLSHEQQTTSLRVRAMRDGLTGLLNRTEFRARVEERISRTRRTSDSRGAMLMADLDDFKELNDGYGHAAGDRALKLFGAACETSLEVGDLAGRLGGDEFGMLVSEDSRAEEVAAEVTRRFRASDSAGPLPGVSFGIAPVRPVDDVDHLMARADAALYRAKDEGSGGTVRYEVGDSTA